MIPLVTVPNHLDGEQATIGAMLMDSAAIAEAIEQGMTPERFYREYHRTIVTVIYDLHEAGEPADLISVGMELRKRGKLGEDGPAYLVACVEACPSSANVKAYTRPVQDTSDLRAIAAGAETIQRAAYGDDADPDALLSQLEDLIGEVSAGRQSQNFRTSDEILSGLTDEFVQRQKGVTPGVPTGFIDYDEMTGGLQPKELTIVAARPGMGKSALAMNIAERVARNTLHPVVVFSLEMSGEQMIERMVSGSAHVESRDLKRGKLHQDEWESVARGVAELTGLPFLISDATDMTASQMRAKVKSVAAQYGGVSLVVVDYLQIIDGNASAARHEELQRMVRALSKTAKENACPVLCLSQLSRKCEEREDKRPLLSDLRESGAIEQEAHAVVFIYRDAYYKRRHDGDAWGPNEIDDNTAEIIVAKHRNGPTGTVKLAFLPEYARFENLARTNGYQP